jgi:hypothetical protein
MSNKIQYILTDPAMASFRRKGGAFSLGVVVGACLGHFLPRKKVIEIYPPEPNNIAYLYNHNVNDVLSQNYTEHLTQTDESVGDNIEFVDTGDIVLDPPSRDPREIQVDFEALERRDQLIAELGVAAGMEQFQREYSQKDSTEEDAIVVNIFGDSADAEWDQEAEESTRTRNAPYVIHKDEFYLDDQNYHQTTLTYYEGDNVLASQEETPVYNFTEVIGELKFGHGSGDRNVFFVRNDKLKAEYEIIRDTGHYSVEVLGNQIEVGHSRSDLKHSMPRFRLDE